VWISVGPARPLDAHGNQNVSAPSRFDPDLAAHPRDELPADQG
jgi:hypothetical protein